MCWTVVWEKKQKSDRPRCVIGPRWTVAVNQALLTGVLHCAAQKTLIFRNMVPFLAKLAGKGTGFQNLRIFRVMAGRCGGAELSLEGAGRYEVQPRGRRPFKKHCEFVQTNSLSNREEIISSLLRRAGAPLDYLLISRTEILQSQSSCRAGTRRPPCISRALVHLSRTNVR